jgi:hypothetical protein
LARRVAGRVSARHRARRGAAWRGARLLTTPVLVAGVFFWSFPAKAVAQHKSDEEAALAAAARDEAAAAAALEAASSPADAARRAQKQAELEGAQQRALSLKAEVAAKAEYDPALLEALEAKVKIAKAGADRWTSNVLEIKSIFMRKYGKDAKEASAMLQINDDFDYI